MPPPTDLRSTLLIGAKAAQTNYYAETQAKRIGLPLTHMVTINYACTNLDPRDAVPAFSRLRRNHFNKWATRPRRHAGPAFAPTYAYAFENLANDAPFLTMAPGDPHNVHVHWAIHLPSRRVVDFGAEIWGWLETTTGGVTSTEAIDVVPIDLSLKGYLAKGTPPPIARLYARGRASQPQGIIYGRRADTSRNLGPTARRALDRKLGVRRQLPSRPGAPPPPA